MGLVCSLPGLLSTPLHNGAYHSVIGCTQKEEREEALKDKASLKLTKAS